MAWLLSISGANFWDYNVLEAFATIAIIVGTILAIRKWWSNKRRKQNLIYFPNEWSAIRNLSQNTVEVHASADIYFPHYTLSYKGHAYVEGKKFPFQFSKPTQSMNPLRRERWIIIGTTPLGSIPQNVDNIELDIEINLDGEIKKRSGRRVLDITTVGVAPSIPDRKGSQTE